MQINEIFYIDISFFYRHLQRYPVDNLDNMVSHMQIPTEQQSISNVMYNRHYGVDLYFRQYR